METKIQYIEVGGKKFAVDPGVVTIAEWMKITTLIEEGNKDAAGTKMVEMVVKALGKGAESLSIVYLPIIIPRVMEILGRAMMPADLDTELDEILNRKPPTES
jgi:hypothetical protein